MSTPTPEVAATIAKFRKDLIRTLVDQGADEQYATLYVEARVHFSDTSGHDGKMTGKVVASMGSGDDYIIGVPTAEGLRSFARRMRQFDRTAQLGGQQLPGMSRAERLEIAHDNFIDALLLRGASLKDARHYVANHVTFGVHRSDGPVIAQLANGAQFEDSEAGVRMAAGALQSLHPNAPLTVAHTDSGPSEEEIAAHRNVVASAL